MRSAEAPKPLHPQSLDDAPWTAVQPPTLAAPICVDGFFWSRLMSRPPLLLAFNCPGPRQLAHCIRRKTHLSCPKSPARGPMALRRRQLLPLRAPLLHTHASEPARCGGCGPPVSDSEARTGIASSVFAWPLSSPSPISLIPSELWEPPSLNNPSLMLG